MLLIHSYHVSNAGHLPAGSCAATTGLSRQPWLDAWTAAPHARRMKRNTPPAKCTSNQELCSLIVSQKALQRPTAACVPACAWRSASANGGHRGARATGALTPSAAATQDLYEASAGMRHCRRATGTLEQACVHCALARPCVLRSSHCRPLSGQRKANHVVCNR